MKLTLLGLLCTLLLFSCKKDEELPAVDFGYAYFPLSTGTYRHYLVDSIHHDVVSDTSAFQIKEVVGQGFTDNTGHSAYEVLRYKRAANGMPWLLQAVWTQKRTITTAERVEDNERYVRLVFPVNEEKIWNGNAYNTRDPWNYYYSNIDLSYQSGPFVFGRTVTVQQRNNVNLVDVEQAFEVYAADVGLIHKRLIDYQIQEDGLHGIEMEMRLIDYGQE